MSVEFDEKTDEATVTVEQPSDTDTLEMRWISGEKPDDSDGLEVLLNGEVKKEIENPQPRDKVTVDPTERDRRGTRTRRDG